MPRKPRFRRLSGRARRAAFAAAEKSTAKMPSANVSPPGNNETPMSGSMATSAQKNVRRVMRIGSFPRAFILLTNTE